MSVLVAGQALTPDINPRRLGDPATFVANSDHA
jgi:hypothetical protein